jgi:hypothetical protein
MKMNFTDESVDAAAQVLVDSGLLWCDPRNVPDVVRSMLRAAHAKEQVKNRTSRTRQKTLDRRCDAARCAA